VAGYSYDNLSTYINDMRDAAVDATMHLLGYGGSTTEGYSGGNPPVNVTPLGSRYEGSTMVHGGQVTDPTGQYASTIVIPPGWPFHDLPSMIDYYNNEITELFSDWWQMPRPDEFDAIKGSARQAAHLLAYDAETDAGPGCAPFGANIELSNISTMNLYLSNFDGAAIRTFVANYGTRLPLVVNGQDAAACMIWTAVAGEQKIWEETRQSIANIAGEGLAAMKASDDGGGGGVGAVLTVVGAVALIAAPFTGGTSVVGAVNAVGVVLQTASAFVPKGDQKPVPLGGSTPIEVISNIRGALDQLSDDISKEELGIANSMEQIKELITGDQSASFNMSTPSILQDESAGSYRTADDTKVRTETLLWIADTVMPTVTQQFKGAIAALEDCQNSGPFERPSGIGLSSLGPYLDWNSLVATLRLAIVQSKNQLDLVSERLVHVADDFDQTDAQISEELAQHTREVDQTVYGDGR
jgi:hypothetical protein